LEGDDGSREAGAWSQRANLLNIHRSPRSTMRLCTCKELAHAPAEPRAPARRRRTELSRSASRSAESAANRLKLPIMRPQHLSIATARQDPSRHDAGRRRMRWRCYTNKQICGCNIMRANTIFFVGNCLNNGHRRYMARRVSRYSCTVGRNGPWPNASNARPRRSISFPLEDVPPAPPTARAPKTTPIATRHPRVEFGSGWYHDAAIEAEQPAKQH
jgi:hypothetical protein